jgi:hypothetical protein
VKIDSEIQHKKDILELPYKKDQLEYWGPINTSFANSFLTMADLFIQQYFTMLNAKVLKSLFSSLVEMVQNISEYAETSKTDGQYQAFIRVKGEDNQVVINTANRINSQDRATVEAIFESTFAIPKENLQEEYKKQLLSGGSLGLIMLRKLNNAKTEYTLTENEEGDIWLGIELKMNYGNT